MTCARCGHAEHSGACDYALPCCGTPPRCQCHRTSPVVHLVGSGLRRTECGQHIPEFPDRQPDGSYEPSLYAHWLLSRVTCRACRGLPVDPLSTVRLIDLGD